MANLCFASRRDKGTFALLTTHTKHFATSLLEARLELIRQAQMSPRTLVSSVLNE